MIYHKCNDSHYAEFRLMSDNGVVLIPVFAIYLPLFAPFLSSPEFAETKNGLDEGTDALRFRLFPYCSCGSVVEYFLSSMPTTLNLVQANNFANSKEVLLTSKQLIHSRTIIYLDWEKRIFTEGKLVSIGSKKLRSSVLRMSFEFHKGKTFSLLHCGYAVAALRRHTQQLLLSNSV